MNDDKLLLLNDELEPLTKTPLPGLPNYVKFNYLKILILFARCQRVIL